MSLSTASSSIMPGPQPLQVDTQLASAPQVLPALPPPPASSPTATTAAPQTTTQNSSSSYYDPTVAYTAALLSVAAYNDDPAVQLVALQDGHKNRIFSGVAHSDLAATDGKFVLAMSADGTTLYCAIRGTFMAGDDPLVDWKRNVFAVPNISGVGIQHSGFWQRSQVIPQDLLSRHLHKDGGENNRLVICGHSLAAAVANLVTVQLLYSLPHSCHGRIQMFGFATPLSVAGDAVKQLNRLHRDRFVHFVNTRDIVPKIVSWAHALLSQNMDQLAQAAAKAVGSLCSMAKDGISQVEQMATGTTVTDLLIKCSFFNNSTLTKGFKVVGGQVVHSVSYGPVGHYFDIESQQQQQQQQVPMTDEQVTELLRYKPNDSSLGGIEVSEILHRHDMKQHFNELAKGNAIQAPSLSPSAGFTVSSTCPPLRMDQPTVTRIHITRIIGEGRVSISVNGANLCNCKSIRISGLTHLVEGLESAVSIMPRAEASIVVTDSCISFSRKLQPTGTNGIAVPERVNVTLEPQIGGAATNSSQQQQQQQPTIVVPLQECERQRPIQVAHTGDLLAIVFSLRLLVDETNAMNKRLEESKALAGRILCNVPLPLFLRTGLLDQGRTTRDQQQQQRPSPQEESQQQRGSPPQTLSFVGTASTATAAAAATSNAEDAKPTTTSSRGSTASPEFITWLASEYLRLKPATPSSTSAPRSPRNQQEQVLSVDELDFIIDAVRDSYSAPPLHLPLPGEHNGGSNNKITNNTTLERLNIELQRQHSELQQPQTQQQRPPYPDIYTTCRSIPTLAHWFNTKDPVVVFERVAAVLFEDVWHLRDGRSTAATMAAMGHSIALCYRLVLCPTYQHLSPLPSPQLASISDVLAKTAKEVLVINNNSTRPRSPSPSPSSPSSAASGSSPINVNNNINDASGSGGTASSTSFTSSPLVLGTVGLAAGVGAAVVSAPAAIVAGGLGFLGGFLGTGGSGGEQSTWASVRELLWGLVSDFPSDVKNYSSNLASRLLAALKVRDSEAYYNHRPLGELERDLYLAFESSKAVADVNRSALATAPENATAIEDMPLDVFCSFLAAAWPRYEVHRDVHASRVAMLVVSHLLRRELDSIGIASLDAASCAGKSTFLDAVAPLPPTRGPLGGSVPQRRGGANSSARTRFPSAVLVPRSSLPSRSSAAVTVTASGNTNNNQPTNNPPHDICIIDTIGVDGTDSAMTDDLRRFNNLLRSFAPLRVHFVSCTGQEFAQEQRLAMIIDSLEAARRDEEAFGRATLTLMCKADLLGSDRDPWDFGADAPLTCESEAELRNWYIDYCEQIVRQHVADEHARHLFETTATRRWAVMLPIAGYDAKNNNEPLPLELVIEGEKRLVSSLGSDGWRFLLEHGSIGDKATVKHHLQLRVQKVMTQPCPERNWAGVMLPADVIEWIARRVN